MNNEIKKEETAIYMLPEDAVLFILFQKHYEVFKVLVEKRVFEQKGAQILLHFDNKGVLRTIGRTDVLYSSATNFTNSN